MKDRMMLGTLLVVAVAAIGAMQLQVTQLRSKARESDHLARTLAVEMGRLESAVAVQEQRTEEVGAKVEASTARVDGLAGEVETRHTQLERRTRVALTHASTRLQQDVHAQIGAVLDRQRELSSHVEHLETVSAAERATPDELFESLILPTVQIRCGGDVGAGAIVYSRPNATGAYETYVLSAFHVVSEVVKKDGDSETRDPVDVRAQEAGDAAVVEVQADVVSYQEDLDLVLLKLRSDRRFAHITRLAPREKLKAMGRFTPIYTVGCPLGHDPMPSKGEITNLSKDVNGRRFWIVSAPTIFGNSGGGVFLADTRELVGVCSMVCVYHNLIPVPVSHMGVMVPGEVVLDWLDSQYLHYVYDPAVKKQGCDWMRAAMRGVQSTALAATWEY